MASVCTARRRRLGASVAVVLAVTVGAGVVVAPGAAAAPASVAAATATTADVPRVALDTEIVSTGDSGYLTSRKDDSGAPVLEWHRYADGTVVPVGSGTMGYDSNSDIAVTGDGGGKVFLKDMREGATWSASYDLASEFGAGAEVVGVVGDNLFVKTPTGTADYHQLWQLSHVDGVPKKTNRSASVYSIDFKVIASTSATLLLLESNRVFPNSWSHYTQFWRTRTTVDPASSLPDSRRSIAPWTQASTGAYSADYEAHVEYRGGVTELAVDGTYVHPDFAMDSSMSGAVIVGIVRDTLLYGVPGTAGDDGLSPLYARSITHPDTAPFKLLEDFSSVAHAPDGGLIVRGATAEADGLFRIWEEIGGLPGATLMADTGRVLAVRVAESNVPTAVDLEKPGTTVPMEWVLNRANATVDLTLTHAATGKEITRRLAHSASGSASGSRFAFTWDGVLDGVSAPNGAYTWRITATPTDGIGGPATASGDFRVSRRADPHDFNDNGSPDILARDASGVLWRDDLFDWPSNGQVTPAERTRIGGGWQIYDRIEATGDIGGATTGDLVARDRDGVLWEYLGKGDGTFASRVRIGAGWGVYDKITAGSDFTGDGRADLLATDTRGDLYLYKGTGSWRAPYEPRVKIGWGWGIYNELTATGDIAGAPAGDLVARDRDGVLWLYLGKGDGSYASRVKIGAGWNMYSHLVGAGDVTADGRPDLIGYGPNGTYVYRSTGSWSTPFTRQTTTLYEGEGTRFDDVS